jgi:hypothetical protein
MDALETAGFKVTESQAGEKLGRGLEVYPPFMPTPTQVVAAT